MFFYGVYLLLACSLLPLRSSSTVLLGLLSSRVIVVSVVSVVAVVRDEFAFGVVGNDWFSERCLSECYLSVIGLFFSMAECYLFCFVQVNTMLVCCVVSGECVTVLE
jgi:hypothetical protein